MLQSGPPIGKKEIGKVKLLIISRQQLHSHTEVETETGRSRDFHRTLKTMPEEVIIQEKGSRDHTGD